MFSKRNHSALAESRDMIAAMIRFYMRTQFPHIGNPQVEFFRSDMDYAAEVIRVGFHHHGTNAFVCVEWSYIPLITSDWGEHIDPETFFIPQEKIVELMLLAN